MTANGAITVPRKKRAFVALITPANWEISAPPREISTLTRPRSVDYPFTVIESHMPKEGAWPRQGVGCDAHQAMGKTISLENFATTPVQLNQVKSETRTRS